MTNITINQSISFLPSSFMTPCLSCCFWDGNGSSQILAHSWKVALEVMLPAGLACKNISQSPEI